MRIAKPVQSLTPYAPGEQPKSHAVIKLNTNENPYPPSPSIAKVLSSFNLDNLRRYPDPVFRDLRLRIAELNNTKPECVFVGNGSDEVLAIAARAFVNDDEKIGSCDPSYSLYKTLAAIRNVDFVPSPLGENFSWKTPVVENVALFLLTNPNAPTGVCYPEEDVAKFAKRFPGVVLIDEAYADFAEHNLMHLATDVNNASVIVMRTLSKSFSLAGLRLGYCVGPEDLIEAMYKVKDSYNVDALAQAVALAALYDIDWMKSNTAKVLKTREWTVRELRKRGWDVPDSQTNFVFAKPARKKAAELFEQLRGRHIYVRYFIGPETGDRLRVSIGTDSDMMAFMDAVDELDRA